MLIDASRPDAYSPAAEPIAVIARPLGRQTNNYAEYTAVVLALERALSLGAREVELVLDSKLAVEQLMGRWRVREASLAPLHAQASELLRRFDRWSLRHEGRASNAAADALANLALDDPAAAAAAERSAGSPPPAAASRAPIDYDDSLRRTLRLIDRLYREGSVVARSDGTLHQLFPVSISRTEGEALRGWVEREAASRTIEVGLGYGLSALFMCAGLLTNGRPDARHVAIDPNQQSRFGGCARQLLAEAGLEEVIEFHDEPSEIVLPRLLAADRSFDVAFVDGNHRFDGVFVDLVYLGRLIRPGGIVIVDDYQLPAVRKAASFCTSNLGWVMEELSVVDEHHRWAVLRTPDPPPRRNYDHFVDF